MNNSKSIGSRGYWKILINITQCLLIANLYCKDVAGSILNELEVMGKITIYYSSIYNNIYLLIPDLEHPAIGNLVSYEKSIYLRYTIHSWIYI